MTRHSGTAPGSLPWHERLRQALAERRGARLGESTVVSRQEHAVEGRPEEILILPAVDAGQLFYGRSKPGEIIHIDIFHSVAQVDHRRVAATLLQALGDVPLAGMEGKRLLDHFDLVTGTGGGRLTGSLEYGQKPSLRAAHRNHVHLAGLMPDEQLSLLVRLVSLVEAELLAQGVELRRVERLRHGRPGQDSKSVDHSPYTDDSDSWLRGQRPPGGAAGPGGSGTGASGGAGGMSAGTAGAGGGGASGAGGGAAGGGSGGGAGATGPWQALDQERLLQQALDISRKLGSPDEARRVLEQFSKEQGWAAAYGFGNSQAPFLIRQLEQEGLLRRELRGIHLTEAGRELAAYLDRHLRDVKLRFRKLIRRLPAVAVRQGARTGPTPPPSPDVRYGPIRGTAPAESGSWIGDLAVPETVKAALTRTHLEQAIAPESERRPYKGLRLTHQDVHVHLRACDHPLHICLLIDASASMAGRRILAAKHLARHLLVSTRDRIAVIAFQERDVRVYVPFTRDWSQVEEGLSRIQPMGLTPLAHGLSQSLDLLRASRGRRPLLLLITDGIPTVAKWTIDPLADALEAARLVGRHRIPFGCIGLQPSRRYLEELTRAAGGTLHVVEELAEDSLVAIAHRERQKIADGGKGHRLK